MNLLNSTGAFLISIEVFVQSGCSRSPKETTNQEPPAVEPMATSNVVTSAKATQLPHLVPQYTNTANSKSNYLWLEDVRGDDAIYRFMADDLIKKNPKARDALLQTKGIHDGGIITEDDVKIISLELSKVKNFVAASHGTAVKFDRFVIAIVGGSIHEDYFNAYLIRIPDYGWIFLETREVPAPLKTSF